MFRYFPLPYPNETIYSLIVRYADKNAYSRNYIRREFSDDGKRYIDINVIFGVQLDKIFNKLLSIYPYSMQDFINDHTILPAFKAFVTSDEYQDLEDSIKYKMSDAIRKVGRVWKPKIKYCKQCIKEDRERYGEAYLHREHQLNGVLYCAKHKCSLYGMNIKNGSLININSDDLENSSKEIQSLEENDKVIALRISEEVDYLLKKYKVLGTYSSTHVKYLQELLEERQLICHGVLAKTQIKDILLASSSLQFLKKLSFRVNSKEDMKHVIYHGGEQDRNPVKNLWFMIVLFGRVLDLENNHMAELNKDELQFQYSKSLARGIMLSATKKYPNLFAESFDVTRKRNILAARQWLLANDKVWLEEQISKWDSVNKMSEEEREIYHLNIIKDFIAIHNNATRSEIEKYAPTSYHWLKKNRRDIFEEIMPSYSNLLLENHKRKIVDFITANPSAIRGDVQKELKTSYRYVYNNDLAFLDALLPLSSPKDKEKLFIKHTKILLEYICENPNTTRSQMAHDINRTYCWFLHNKREYLNQVAPKCRMNINNK